MDKERRAGIVVFVSFALLCLLIPVIIPHVLPSMRYRTASNGDEICISTTGTGSQGIGYRQYIRGDDILTCIEEFNKSTEQPMIDILGKRYRAVRQGSCDLYMFRTVGGGDVTFVEIYHITADENCTISYTVDTGESLLRKFDFYYYPGANDAIEVNDAVYTDKDMLGMITDDLLTVAGIHDPCDPPDTDGMDHICIYHNGDGYHFQENIYIDSDDTIYFSTFSEWTRFDPFEGQYTSLRDIIERYDGRHD
ncbi:MAG: hypothetical protein IKR73_05155 [Oscillospiraceae bacterium]|nr:hypothetical protein [Oscillospiraceae bacterium]